MMRRRQTVYALLAFLAICAYTIFHLPSEYRPLKTGSSPHGRPPSAPHLHEGATSFGPEDEDGNGDDAATRPARTRPKPAPGGSHPMWHLINDAERSFEALKARQSKSLSEAVAEYRRRYGIPPPPNFDKWYEFAKSNDVQLIDEFDSIHEMLTPFWGLKPATIRARAKEALGFDNALLGLLIRDHKVSYIAGGRDWQREATVGMMKKFLQYLPSMDLAFNIHDEPRVVVPHDDLARLVRKAQTETMRSAGAVAKPLNAFTKRNAGLNDGQFFEETKLTRFNVYAHQATWTSSRMSCPPDSPARTLEDDERADDISRYGISDLAFIYNVTAMSDICLSPSLSRTFGFFDRPNAYDVVHDLFPIFSQSKVSSYNDILYPSPWYWYEKVAYDEKKDMAWEKKRDQLYWRGSTTGGFSRNGGWRRQHRQHFVQKINAGDMAHVFVNRGTETAPSWEAKEVPRGDFREIIDVHFSHVGQCDPGDCDAQKEFFDVKDRADQQDAWKYKFLLDMDGNAFSGRFYAFLRSRSLVFKFAIFREWHFDWLRDWVHYIPMSLQGDEWLELVRYFEDGLLGRNEAERMAIQSREWATKVLRKEDLEAWFFRLLLEYGRVQDDNRETIGFAIGSSTTPPPSADVPAKAPAAPPAEQDDAEA